MSLQIYLSVVGIAVSTAIFLATLTVKLILEKKYESQIKLDVTPQQMIEAEKKIAAFLKDNNIVNDTSIETIANVLQIERGEEDPTIKEVQAIISPADEKGKRVVTFKQGLGYAEKNFSFAHECAHIINGDQTPATRPDQRNKPPEEQLADYIAAALLMPYNEVKCVLDITNYSNINKTARLKVIKKLCKQFNVSEIIALRRVNEITTLINKM